MNCSQPVPEFTAEAVLIASGTFAARQSFGGQCRAVGNPVSVHPQARFGSARSGHQTGAHPEQTNGYLRQTSAPLVLQRYAAGPHEIGVFIIASA